MIKNNTLNLTIYYLFTGESFYTWLGGNPHGMGLI